MTVSIGFLILLMFFFIACNSYRLFLTRNLPVFIIFSAQIFIFTIALVSFLRDVKTSQIVEFSYILFGIAFPAGILIYDAFGLIHKLKDKGAWELFIEGLRPRTVNPDIPKEDSEISDPLFMSFLKQGTEYYKKQQYNEAIECYEEALTVRPDSFKGYYNLSVAFDEAGRNEEAIHTLKKVIELKPDFIDAYNNLGILLSSNYKYMEALGIYKQALEKNRNDYKIYFNMGITLSEVHEYKEAVKAFNKALEIKPDEYEVCYHLGAALIELKRYDEAAKIYKSTLHVKPSDSEVFYNLSIVYSLLRKHDIALDNLRKAIELNRDIRWDARSNVAFEGMRSFEEFKKLVS